MITAPELIELDVNELTENEEDFLQYLDDAVRKAYFDGYTGVTVMVPYKCRLGVVTSKLRDLGYNVSNYRSFFAREIKVSWKKLLDTKRIEFDDGD